MHVTYVSPNLKNLSFKVGPTLVFSPRVQRKRPQTPSRHWQNQSPVHVAESKKPLSEAAPKKKKRLSRISRIHTPPGLLRLQCMHSTTSSNRGLGNQHRYNLQPNGVLSSDWLGIRTNRPGTSRVVGSGWTKNLCPCGATCEGGVAF